MHRHGNRIGATALGTLSRHRTRGGSVAGATLVSALLLIALATTVGTAWAAPDRDAPLNDPVPQQTTPDEDECVENPVPGGVLCAPEIVVTATPTPEPPVIDTSPDLSRPDTPGLSPGAGSDANKRLDLLIAKLDARMERCGTTTTGNYWDGTDSEHVAEAINDVHRQHDPRYKTGDPIVFPPQLDRALEAGEWERRWDDATKYLQANGWVFDMRRQQWKRFTCV